MRTIVLVGLLVAVAGCVGLACDEGAVLVLPGGDIEVRYLNNSTTPPTEERVIFVPETKFVPVVTESHTFDPQTGLYTYTYTLTNSPASPQQINMFFLKVMVGVSNPAAPAPQWEFEPEGHAIKGGVGWWFSFGVPREDRATHGLLPGQVGTFSFRSASPPGALTAYLKGFTPMVDFPGELPDCVADLLLPYEMAFVQVPTVGPVRGGQ